jgi:tetratricopeptide (TPR) repeat protein
MATVAPSEAKEKAAPRDPRAPVVAEVQRQGDALRIVFPFAVPTPAAVFRRADTLWLVFDAKVPIDITALNEQALSVIRRADIARAPEGQVLRVRLERPRLASAVTEGTTWTVTVGDAVIDPTLPLAITRAIVTPGRSNAIIPFDEPGQFYRLTDPEVGDRLFVVTGLPPARGFLKMQEFIEFNALASTHGIAIQPLADDVSIELAPDKVLINRPGGLTLSAFEQTPHRSTARPVLFDPQAWGFDRQSNYLERQALLLRSAAEAIESRRAAARHDLARFYLARDMYHEAKAVLDVALTEKQVSDDAAPIVLHAIANIMINRPEAALKDLANPVVGSQHDAPLWRALAFARQARWGDALSGFKGAQTALGTLPIELQQLILREHVRAAIEVRDFSDASTTLNELTALNPLQENDPAFAVLTGRLAEGLGRNDEALAAYHKAAESLDRLASVQGRLRELLLRYRLGDLKNAEAVVDLETITTTWRGDETEIEALQLLARLYTSEGRYRDAFQVMRSALLAHPTSDLTRRIHEEAAATFDTLFLEGKGDSLPAIEALGLFYDFRELTSIGRRGDEMIRRLSDRLVAVDLLTQAAELLQHQVDNRLTGAARAQVAVRLAVIYLMNRKPDRALQVLRATRMSDLPGHLRNQRLLIEARALSDTGRPDLALEVVANIEGREAERLRADVLWSARRWVPTAEQIERMLGNRWRDWGPLTGAERTDVLRASIGYVLGEDPMGLDRLREKFEPKMADTPDRRAFEVITAPVAARGNEFREVVKTVAAIDTLEGFLSDMRKSYPETGPLPPNKASPAPAAPAASQTLAPSPTRAAAVQ